ncbi:MAG: hypothetical protein IRZ16_00600 [Myxococcaceae bacterium]|nr:hypothetical protein [Myxococcaceae bacterium]
MRSRAKPATTVAPALTGPRPGPAAEPLQFDFEGRRTNGAPPPSGAASTRDGSIKESIIRWLNEQL